MTAVKSQTHPPDSDIMDEYGYYGSSPVPILDLPGSDSDDSDALTEVEIEISTPRLCTPVFDELRRKYPAAFRRRTSASSVCSDASSVYSGSMIIGEVRPRRSRPRQRTRTTDGLPSRGSSSSARDGLPPMHPAARDMSGSSHSARRRPTSNHNAPPKGILKKDRGYYDAGGGGNESEKKTEKLSLKERLRRNREEMKELLSEDKLPFRKKGVGEDSVGDRDVSCHMQNGEVKVEVTQQQSRMDRNNARYSPMQSPRTLQELQNQQNQVLTAQALHGQRSPRTTRDGRSLLDHLKSGKIHKSRRFESPDSAHDSAVDMDSASTQSNPSLENYNSHKVNRQKPPLAHNLSNISEDVRGSLELELASHTSSKPPSRPASVRGVSPAPSSMLGDEEEVVEPIRNSRAPKLKTARRRGRSPSPMTVLGGGASSRGTSPLTVQNVARNQQQLEMGVSGQHRRHGSTGGKDSDCDSGIAGRRKDGSVSSSEHMYDDDHDSVLSANTSAANQRLVSMSRQELKSNRSRPVPPKHNGPMRANHAVMSPRSYRGDSTDTEMETFSPPAPTTTAPNQPSVPIRASKLRSRSPAARNLALPPPPHPGASGRSASVDRSGRKRERVTFEDEVYNKGLRYRSGSQPALNTAATAAGDMQYRYPQDMSDSDTQSDFAYGKRSKNNVKTIHNKFHSDQDLYRRGRYGDENVSPRSQADSRHREGSLPRKVHNNNSPPTPDRVMKAARSPRQQHQQERLPVHRASPVVVLPPKPVKPPRKTKMETQVSTESLLSSIPPPVSPGRHGSPGPGDMDITSEVSFGGASIGSFMEDISFDTPKQKKSKLPWKKNKGRYTPNEELERMKLNILQSNSRAGSWSSLYSESNPMGSVASLNSVSSSKSGKKKGKHKGTMEHHIPKTYVPEPIPNQDTNRHSENPYETVEIKGANSSHVPPQQSHSKASPRTSKNRTEPPYEDVNTAKSPRRSSSGYETVEPNLQKSIMSPQNSQDLASEGARKNSQLRRSIDFENPYEDVRVNDGQMVRRSRESDNVDVDAESHPLGGSGEQNVDHVDSAEHAYAQVDFSKKSPQHEKSSASSSQQPASTDSESDMEAPDLPHRGYESNLAGSKHLSDSRTSLSERMGSFKDSAKKKLSQLRRAISLERVNSSDVEDGSPGKLKKSPSLKSLTDKLPFKKNKQSGTSKSSKPPGLPKAGKKPTIQSPEPVEKPTHFRSIGKVLALNSDGTQLLELHKPPHGPFGFYIAKGNAKYGHGIFISRLSDGLPAHFFAGLLSIGDEILEINNQNLKHLPLENVYELMASSNTLTMKTLPFIARKEK